MHSPFEVLELAPGANEAQVRKQYLSLVRRHSPDRDPEKFKQIRQAYERLCDPITRWNIELFEVLDVPVDQAYGKVRKSLRERRIPMDVLFDLTEE